MTRLNEINSWLDAVLKSQDYDLEPASNDASFRRYFRITTAEKTMILMDAPPQKEDSHAFISVAHFLFKHGLHVPEIIAENTDLGFLLLSDFGSTVYLDLLQNQKADSLYGLAINSLIDMQLCPTNEISLALYDQALLQQEMDLFADWFLQRHLNIAVPEFLPQIFDLLISNALEQPQVFVHRDYHSRNLMHTAINSPGIIDFQDAVIGPISYDLVSLLRDCYISWPADKIDSWIDSYLKQAQSQGLLLDTDKKQFIRWFDLMGLQRHIKILGIFCRLSYRDNKDNYINDLPLTLHYVKQICAKYPELAPLSDFLNDNDKIGAIR